MALTTYTGDTDIISQLDNQPNDNDGLSASELKAKFDQFGAEFTTFFNETHIPEAEAAINAAAQGISSDGVDGSLIIDGSIPSGKLSSTSGSEAVVTAVIKDKNVTKAKLEQSVQDAVDAVSGKASFTTTSVELASDGWSNNSQTIANITGVTASNTIVASPATDDTSYNAWNNNGIRVVLQGYQSLTFKCRTVPSSAVTVNILCLN